MAKLSDYTAKQAIPYMFRNKLMNGAMSINERTAALGTIVALNGDGPYPYLNCVVMPDRWFTALYSPGTNTITANVRQSNDVPPGTEFQCSYQFTTTAGSFDTSPTPNQDIVLHQYIEGYDNAEFNYFKQTESKPLTLSFWVKSSVPGTHSGSWRISPRFYSPENFANYSYVFEYTINQKNTWEYKTISIPKFSLTPSPTPLIFTDSEQSNSLVFKLGTMGARTTTSVNQWLAADYHGSTNSVRVTDTTGETFFLTGVQLEVGIKATPFDLLPYDLELKMCQRYYFRPEVRYQAGSNFGVYATGFPNIMRTAFPTVCASNTPVAGIGYPRNDYFCSIGAGIAPGNPNTLNAVDADMVDWVTDYRGRAFGSSYLNQAQGYLSLLLHFDEVGFADYSWSSPPEIGNAQNSAQNAINIPLTNATTGVGLTAVGTTFATTAGFFKFGTRSFQLPANSTTAYLAIKNSDRFNFGYEPWSIDFWFRSGTITPTLERRVVFSTRNAGTTAGARIFFEGTTNNLLFNFSTNGSNSGITSLSGIPMGATSSTELVHFAVARYKDTIRTYRNGILQYTYTNPNLGPIYHNILDEAAYIGGIQAAGSSYGSSANGYIDEFRIVKGKAVYNDSNFTPPTLAYPTVIASSGGLF